MENVATVDYVKYWFDTEARKWFRKNLPSIFTRFGYDCTRTGNKDLKNKILFHIVKKLPFAVDLKDEEMFKLLFHKMKLRCDWWFRNFTLDVEAARDIKLDGVMSIKELVEALKNFPQDTVLHVNLKMHPLTGMLKILYLKQNH